MPLQLGKDMKLSLLLTAKNMMSKGVKDAKGDVQDLTKTAQKSAKQIETAYSNLGIRSRKEIDREIRRMQASYKRLTASGELSAKEQKRAFKALQNQIKSLRTEAKGAQTDFKGLTRDLSALGGLVIGSAVVGGIRSIVDAGVEMQRIEQSLKAAVGNEKFAAEMKFIRSEADRLGLSLRSASRDYAQMAASAKGTSLEGQKTRDIFKAVAEASAVMGLSAEDTSGAIRAINQMISKGTVSAEELRGQLGERLPGAFQIAARSMNVTTEELGKMLERGELMADQFLPRFGRQITKEMGNRVEEATKRAAASFKRLETAWFDIKVSIANSGLLEALAGAAETGSEHLKNIFAGLESMRLVFPYMANSIIATGEEQKILDEIFDQSTNALLTKYGLLKEEANEFGKAGAKAGMKTADGLKEATKEATKLESELKALGTNSTKSLEPTLKILNKLSESLEDQYQKQAALREKIFNAVGGAAGGYFKDQLRSIKEEAKQMLGASIAEADISAYVEQQLSKLRQQLTQAGAVNQALEIGGINGIQADSIVSELANDLAQSTTETDRLKQQMTELAQAISKAAGNIKEMLPENEAQQLQARFDVLREMLLGVAENADIQANIDTLQALNAVHLLQQELAKIPREIVTVHKMVVMGAGPVPTPPVAGSRATGGEITQDGYYLMHRGEKVISSGSQTFNGGITMNFPSGNMNQTEARAFVRNVVAPELQRMAWRGH